ncbi:Wzz/FepE/Etk N-terminal domain-containing protein [Pseudoalteromonas luteoviolacea]|uniref:Wzz/FepE/Etk N-terminal domain-containing protein n=1 Tax=Pseudoalteromonas luteoviolacea TaxID=43657 RepID=UPI000AFBB1E8|nr:Wzz/FepE/Etk N-terminal domain-containing protein [Pseudoalteromonas luteoviolacea]
MEDIKYQDEVDLTLLVKELWAKKIYIIASVFVSSVIFVLYALSLSNIYKAEAIVVPAESNTSSSLQGLASQFGGVAALAGISLGGSDSFKSDLAIEVMKSRQFISYFIEKYDILPLVMAAEKWHINSNEITFDEDLYLKSENKWVREVSLPKKTIPSYVEAHKEFMDIFNVERALDSNTIVVSIEHVSPVIAKQWVDLLVTEINRKMRERDIVEAKRNIEYLTEKLETNELVQMEAIIYSLLEEQEQNVMLAEVQPEYVFKVIDPAVVPEKKLKPSRALICVFGAFLGAFLSITAILINFTFRRTV